MLLKSYPDLKTSSQQLCYSLHTGLHTAPRVYLTLQNIQNGLHVLKSYAHTPQCGFPTLLRGYIRDT